MSEWGEGAPSLVEIALIALCGGVLGVLFMIPLRQALIVKEHGVLPYPEGQACAEVLIAGEQGGSKAGVVFAGMGIAALYKFVADGLKLSPAMWIMISKNTAEAWVFPCFLPLREWATSAVQRFPPTCSREVLYLG